MDSITQPGIYIFGVGVGGIKPCDYGLLLHINGDAYIQQTVLNLSPQSDQSDLYYIRSQTGTAWQRVTLNMPTFYKDYLTLASLASALGEQLHIKSAKVTPGQTIDISCGYGLFVASNLSNGGIAVFATGVSSVFYAVNSASHIDATISKVSEYVTRVTSNAGTVRIIYLQTESVD